MHGEDPYKMWFFYDFETDLIMVVISGSFDCAAGEFVFIPFAEVYF
jgi:hypothetical protein